MRIAILGPESTGKSTLAQALASHFGYALVPEYARTYVEQLHRAYTIDDVLTIARHQVDELADTRPDIIYDTEMIITKVWLEHKYGTCPAWVDEAIQRYPMDLYLLCYPDIAWEADPTRENPHLREALFERYEQEIQRTHVPYIIVRGRVRELLLKEQTKSISDLLDRDYLNG